MNTSLFGAATAALIGLAAPPAAGTTIAGTDGTVLATALSGDGQTLYIGGDFTRAGMPTGSFVPVDAQTGAVAAHLNVNNSVDTQIPDGNGGWYIAGSFTRVGRSAQAHVAHILPDGSLDKKFKPMPGVQVVGMALKGRRLYLSGCAAGDHQCFVRNLDAATGTKPRWEVAISGGARRLAISGSSLYLGGSFLSVGGADRNRLAALDTATGSLLPWNPAPGNGNGVPFIHTIVPAGAIVYVGGDFQTIGGAARASVAALDATSGQALAWNAGIGSYNGVTDVRAIVREGSKVYLGGKFSMAGGQSRGGVAVLDSTSGVALPWDAGLTFYPPMPPIVTALAVNDARIFIAGEFKLPGTTEFRYSAALDKGSAAALPWLDAGSSGIAQLSVQGSQVFAGGSFALLGGEIRNHLAAIDLATGGVTAWNPDAPSVGGDTSIGVVRQLLVRGSTVYAGGTFTRIGGADRQGLAALNTTTGAAKAWSPQLDGEPTTFSASSSTLYVGGIYITNVDGQPRKGLAAFDLASGQLTPWAPNAFGASALKLVATDTIVYLGGAFSTINGQTRNGLAALDPGSAALLAWNPDARSPFPGFDVVDMALAQGTMYLVGEFNSVGGQSRSGLAAVDAVTGAVLPWQPIGVSHPRTLAVRGDNVYVALMQGGGDPPAQAVLTMSIAGNAVIDTDYVVEGWVDSILATKNHLYFGGQFNDSNAGVAVNLADFAR